MAYSPNTAQFSIASLTKISELPNGTTLTGSEYIPIDQENATVKVPTGSIAQAFTQGFVTIGAMAPLPNARSISAGDNITITDNGPGADLVISSSASGLVDSVSNSDGTLSISPTTGDIIASRSAISGDISIPSASNTATLATVNGNIGSFSNANITVNAKGLITAATAGAAGDVFGPASSIDNAIARFDGVTGKLIQDSHVIIDDSDNVTGMSTLTLPNTGLHILGQSTAFDLVIQPFDTFTADRTLTIATGDHDRILSLNGNLTISNNFTTSGGSTIQFFTTGTTFLTLPTSGTVLSTTATQTVTNKSMVDSSTLFIDDADNTKKFQFQASGITTGTTRTLTVQDANGTIALTSDLHAAVTLAGQNYLSIAGQVITANAVDLSGTNAAGTLAAGRFPALTGDITTSAGALATTLATVNSNVGSFTNASITVNAKGLITAASNGASSSPGGSNTQVQFNDSGGFGGDAGLIYNKATDALTIAGFLTTPAINGGIAANDDITIQGTTNATRTTSYVLIQPNGGSVIVGAGAPTQQFEITGNFAIPATTSSAGAIYQGSGRIIHSFGSQNFFIGASVGNVTNTGSANFAMGNTCMTNLTSGSDNSCMGVAALRDITGGTANLGMGSSAGIQLTTGSKNNLIGNFAGFGIKANNSNNGLGYAVLSGGSLTGASNNALGENAGSTISSGSFNLLLGDHADVSVGTITNAIAIGKNASVGASNTMVLGGAGSDTVNVQTAGNMMLMVAGKGFQIKEGTNARMGVATLAAGTVTISNTSVTANSRLFFTVYTPGGLQGILSYAISAGVSFTINSTSITDTSIVNWIIFEGL